MNMIRVTQPYSSSSLNEILQAQQVKFALVKPENSSTFTCLMPYVMCRDYLKEMLFSQRVLKKPVEQVYGFNTGDYPFMDIPTEALYMAVKSNHKNINNIITQQTTISEYEKKMGADSSIWLPYEDGKQIGIVVIADPRWMDSLLGLSFYSFLYRWMAWGDKQLVGEDANLADNALWLIDNTTIDQVAKCGFVFGKNLTDTHQLHNYHGLKYAKQSSYMQIFQSANG